MWVAKVQQLVVKNGAMQFTASSFFFFTECDTNFFPAEFRVSDHRDKDADGRSVRAKRGDEGDHLQMH